MDKVQAVVYDLTSAELTHPAPLPPSQDTITPLLLDVISTAYAPAVSVYETCSPSISVRLSATTMVPFLSSPPPPQAETMAQTTTAANIDFINLPALIKILKCLFSEADLTLRRELLRRVQRTAAAVDQLRPTYPQLVTRHKFLIDNLPLRSPVDSCPLKLSCDRRRFWFWIPMQPFRCLPYIATVLRLPM